LQRNVVHVFVHHCHAANFGVFGQAGDAGAGCFFAVFVMQPSADFARGYCATKRYFGCSFYSNVGNEVI
jgi:hypothetical protein